MTHLLLISVFLDVLLIRPVWDPMAPAITQQRVILNATRFIFQTEIHVYRQIK